MGVARDASRERAVARLERLERRHAEILASWSKASIRLGVLEEQLEASGADVEAARAIVESLSR